MKKAEFVSVILFFGVVLTGLYLFFVHPAVLATLLEKIFFFL